MAETQRPRALITGATGQDGALLAELLLARGYAVHALMRPVSTGTPWRVAHLLAGDAPYVPHVGDVTDTLSLTRVLAAAQPHELYHLAAQSHVPTSFQLPEHTAETDAVGAVRVLEAVRLAGLADQCRIYMASTSEMFGRSPPPQDESTPFRPCSPYAAAKVHAHWAAVTYREAHGLHVCTGIAFNHESPLRGEAFVTRRISRGVARMAAGDPAPLRLGTLTARRDWSHARDVVEGMRRALNRDAPGDYVFASGKSRSVRAFVDAAFAAAGLELTWEADGTGRPVGVDPRSGRVRVISEAARERPAEPAEMRGNPDKAWRELGWRAATPFHDLVAEMVRADLAAQRRGDGDPGAVGADDGGARLSA